MKGRLIELSRSFNGKLRVMFEVDAVDEVVGMQEKDLDITVKPHRQKRSLNANAYFHVLVGKIAEAVGISKPRAKNLLLGRYGQREIANESPLIISVLSKADLYEREDIHCIPVGHAVLQGKEFTHWAVIRPSHTYDTAEMSKLIDGAVSEAKELGIETLVPAEIERMKRAWESRYYNKNESVLSAEPQQDWSAIM